MLTKNKHISLFAEILLIVSILGVGLFYDFSAQLVGAVLGVFLTFLFFKNKNLTLYINLPLISLCSIAFFYALSGIWAADKGTALPGFFRFLPVLLFLVLLMQTEKDEKDKILRFIPLSAVVMTVISAILMQIPALAPHFSVAGRLAGFFAYPNTFALFLLVSLIITITKEKAGILNIVYSLILIGGILYSGSRTVFVLMAVALIASVFTIKNKKVKWGVIIGAVVFVATAVIIALAFSGVSAFSRFLTISLSSSTFVGRFLYFKDALSIIIKYPFGTGYLGYYYLQQSVQTGLYSVRFVHNDFLQLVLDVGFIPALLFIAAVIKSFFSKNTPTAKKIIILVFSAHACFDFDLQFIAIFMLFIVLLDTHSGKKVCLKNPYPLGITLSLLSVISLYFALAFGLMALSFNEASYKVYKANTQNDTALLTSAETVEEMDRIASRIINRNKNVSVAYSAKARVYYSKGDFGKVMEYKEKVFGIAPLVYEEYEEYCSMLITGINLYEQAGDKSSADICRRELINCKDRLESNQDLLSREGKLIKDQPKFELPDDISNYIELTEAYFENE